MAKKDTGKDSIAANVLRDIAKEAETERNSKQDEAVNRSIKLLTEFITQVVVPNVEDDVRKACLHENYKQEDSRGPYVSYRIALPEEKGAVKFSTSFYDGYCWQDIEKTLAGRALMTFAIAYGCEFSVAPIKCKMHFPPEVSFGGAMRSRFPRPVPATEIRVYFKKTLDPDNRTKTHDFEIPSPQLQTRSGRVIARTVPTFMRCRYLPEGMVAIEHSGLGRFLGLKPSLEFAPLPVYRPSKI